jgi:S-formylglutathione hydrolase FrmB
VRRPLACAALLVLASCASPPAVHTPRAPALEGDVVVPAGVAPKGRLVLGWRTKAEQAELDAGQFSLALIRRLIERLEPGAEVDFAKTPRVHYRIEGAPADATPAVVLDVDHTFWPTFLGGGHGLSGSGASGGGEVKLAPNPPRTSGGEPCAGPRYRLLQIEGRGLAASASNAGRPEIAGRRRFCAWLPASWSESSPRRYPIVLLLPGFMSTEMSYLSGKSHIGTRLDAISAETHREAILVGVDTSTPLGSTYLEDSVANGPFATFLAGPALAEIERTLHAIPRRTGRALLGQSTGGYNALSYGLRRSDTFSVVLASSPDAPDMEHWLIEPGTRRAREWLRRWTALEDAVGGAGQMTSYAAEWSDGKGKARWPFALSTGAVDEAALATWVAKTPHGLLRDPAFAARAKADLSGRVLIAVGKNDEFELYAPAERFAKELETLGITTKFVPTEQGHGGHEERFETALRFALERLDVE